MFKMFLMAAVAAVVLYGCDLFQSPRIAYMEKKHRQTCLGIATNSCVALRAQHNIKAARLFLEDLEKDRSNIVDMVGQKGYDALFGHVTNLIEINKDDRPNLFLRLLFPNDQVLSPRKQGEYLLTRADFEHARRAVVQRYAERGVGKEGIAWN